MFLPQVVGIPAKHPAVGPDTHKIHPGHGRDQGFHRILKRQTICCFYFMAGTRIFRQYQERILRDLLSLLPHTGYLGLSAGRVHIKITGHGKTAAAGAAVRDEFQAQVCVIYQARLAHSGVIKTDKLAVLARKGQDQVLFSLQQSEQKIT